MNLPEDIENIIQNYIYQIDHVKKMKPILQFISKFDYKTTKRDLHFVYKCCYQKHHNIYVYLPIPVCKLKFNE